MNRRQILAVGGASAAVSIVSQFTVATESRRQPPPMTLRAESGETQRGGIGTYCWDGVCVDMIGTPYPEVPLAVTVGEPLALDFAEFGPLRQLAYWIWPYVASRLEPQRPPVDEMDPPLRETEIRHPDSPVSLPSDLPPGLYAIKIFADTRRGGDTYQGFTILVSPALVATPVATPGRGRDAATPVAWP